ncbi:MAG: T9SS type A sorting domain-containing protein, partial [Chlamydiia bacterium]|nr:T9SS type A sorting domain-containing protein [Chlamydiia bacterium]
DLTVVATVAPEEIELGEEAQLNAVVSGGLGNYIYNWSSYPEGYSSDTQNPITSPDYTTVYFIEASDGESIVEDSIVLIVYAEPATPSQPIGPDSVELANTEISEYYALYIPGALTYNWTLSPENAGTLEPDANKVDIHWNTEFSGWCNLSINAINEYGESEYSEDLEIYIDYIIGIDKLSNKQIHLYPNPANDQIHISGILLFNKLSIRNNLGQIMYLTEINDQKELVINTQQLMPGIYYILLENNNKTEVRKFIRQ